MRHFMTMVAVGLFAFGASFAAAQEKQAPVQKPIQAPTQKVSPVQKPTQAPTQKGSPVQKPVQKPTQKPTQKK